MIWRFKQHEQAALVKTIGARLRYARETLCNLSQQEAARRLGYENPSKLSKIENASDTNSVPLWMICKAAKVYGVSIDFLFGLTSDWEPDLRMASNEEAARWVFEAWEIHRRRDMRVVKRLSDQQLEIARSSTSSLQNAERIHAALVDFRRLNPSFDTEMRGSAKLAAAVAISLERAREFYDAYRTMKLEQSRADVEPSIFEEMTHGAPDSEAVE